MKITIAKKLALGLGTMLFLILIMGAVFLWTSRQVQDVMEAYLRVRNLNGMLTVRIVDHFRWMDGLSSGVFIQEKSFKGKLDPGECDLGKWMAVFTPNSEELALPFGAMIEPHNKLHRTAERILAAFRLGNIDAARRIFVEETVPAVTAVQKSLADMKEILRKEEEDEQRRLAAVQRRANVVTLGLTSSLVVFVVLGGVFFMRGINRPVSRVREAMQRVAKGDLREKVQGATSSDELGQMASYTNEMIDSLSAMIGQIKANSDQLVATSAQIAAAAEQTSKNSESSAAAAEEMTSTMHEMSASIKNVAKNTQKQASSVVRTTSSIEQMVASIRRVAENVKRLVSISEKSRQAVSAGSSAVDRSSNGMAEINMAIQHSTQTIVRLGSRTEEMGSIVEVIDGIADQTNLLALNAAIEAARAGEQGVGFAVVAEEVRKLADRSAKSTREIADLIKSVATSTQAAVENMTRSTGIVEAGLVSSLEVIKALKGIEEAVDEVSRYAGEIGAATHEQSSGSEQIGQAMADLNEVTHEISTAAKGQFTGIEHVVMAIERVRAMVQQNASGAGQLAFSAEQLSRQSAGLQGLVERFSLRT